MKDKYIASLKSVFIESFADYIVIESQSSKFLKDCTNWAVDNGILQNDTKTSEMYYPLLIYRLTDRGKEILNAR